MMHRPRFNDVVYGLLILGISGLLLVFLVERATLAPLTLDEAATYLHYVFPGAMAVFNFNSANNHVINTLLVKGFSALAGNSEFVLRLPNLLAFVVYLLFSFLILRRYVGNKILVLFGYFLLAANPYVLDFFSLCRGYGLSLAFLMGALYFFFSFLSVPADSRPPDDRRLRFSLAAACLAVLSNFSLLNVYLGLVLIAFGLFWVWNRRGQRQPPQDQTAAKSRKIRPVFWSATIAAAALFNVLVISQDFTLFENMFEPLTINITGLSEPDKREVEVFRVDVRNQPWPLKLQEGIWKPDGPVYFSAVKFRLPAAVMARIQRIEIRIGQKSFAYDSREILKLKSDHPRQQYFVFYSNYSIALKRSLVPVFKPVINWRGDRIFLRFFLARILLVLGISLTIFSFFNLLGFVLRRWRLLTGAQFRILGWTTFGLAAFVGYPLYILKRSGELYWGGRTGFIKDTVFSLINNSFYGNLYFHGQEWVAFALICLVVLGFLVRLIVRYRKKSLAEDLPGLCVLTILAVVSISTIVQRALFDNPYLIGRTGLFLIPLFTLLLIFLFRDLSLGGMAQKVISLSLLAILSAVALAHFVERANTSMTVEWRNDADTKDLLKDLRSIKAREFPGRSKLSLGVGEFFYTSLDYYLRRGASTWLEVDMVPPYPGHDFYYLEENFDRTKIALIKTYPLSGNLLAKLKDD